MSRYIALFFDPSDQPPPLNYVRIDAPDEATASGLALRIANNRILVEISEADELVRFLTDRANDEADYTP